MIFYTHAYIQIKIYKKLNNQKLHPQIKGTLLTNGIMPLQPNITRSNTKTIPTARPPAKNLISIHPNCPLLFMLISIYFLYINVSISPCFSEKFIK